MENNIIIIFLLAVLISGCALENKNDTNKDIIQIDTKTLILKEIEKSREELLNNYSNFGCKEKVELEKYEICLEIYYKIKELTEEFNKVLNSSEIINIENIESKKNETPKKEENNKEIKYTPITNEKYDKYAEYTKNKKEISLKYVLRGNFGTINLVVYDKVNEYYKNVDRTISYYYIEPTSRDFIMKIINDEMQRYFLKELVEKIKNKTSNIEDQARIAISLVQNIPYDYESLNSGDLKDRYPYQVLYDFKGVCGEKTKLTAILLQELGFGTSIFIFEEESHEAFGIKCSEEYDYMDSGFCFVETTTPTIITESEGEYLNTGQLNSEPELVIISEGNSLNSVSEEYIDKKEYLKLVNKGGYLSNSEYSRWKSIVNKYGIQLED